MDAQYDTTGARGPPLEMANIAATGSSDGDHS